MKILEKVKLPLAALAVMVLSFGGVLAISAGNDTYAETPTLGSDSENKDDNSVGKKVYPCLDGSQGVGTSYDNACSNQDSKVQHETDLMSTLNTIVNVVIGVIAFIAVVMIIIGGIQYTISAGDTGKVTKAKNTIMYGVIGLVIALLAFAIVNFVLTNVFSGGSSSSSSSSSSNNG